MNDARIVFQTLSPRCDHQRFGGVDNPPECGLRQNEAPEWSTRQLGLCCFSKCPLLVKAGVKDAR